MGLKRYLLLFGSCFLFPLFSIELFSQLKFSKGYAYKFFSGNNFDFPELKKYGLHYPHLRLINDYKTIYPDHSVTKSIKFNTDKFGTIKPSGLRIIEQRIDESILFCGGSTTEGVAIEEGKRVPDVFSSISKIPSINAGKSGKNLEGCIKTINFVLSNFGKPRKIIIATNINTIGQFAKIKSGLIPNNINQKVDLTFKLMVKNISQVVFPGTYWSLGEIKGKYLKKTSNIAQKSISVPSNIPPYEVALREGCCFWPSYFNRDKDSAKFDWDKNKNIQEYHEFVSKQVRRLTNLLVQKNYPLENIIIFMEPNSYLNKRTAGLYDFRQFLTSHRGRLLSGFKSAAIIKKYDNKYLSAFEKSGFKGLQIDSKLLGDEYFYDAVHLSPIGSEFIGIFYASQIN